MAENISNNASHKFPSQGAEKVLSQTVVSLQKTTTGSGRKQVEPSSSTTSTLPPSVAAKPGFSSSIFTANPVIEPKQAPEKNILPPPKQDQKLFSDESTFTGLGVHPILATHLEKLKVSVPTEIQRVSIPSILSTQQRDIIIQAQTGSGKTFSFLLPILEKLITSAVQVKNRPSPEFFSRQAGTYAIVLVPTRELAQQIATVLESLLNYTTNSSGDSTLFKHWIVSGIISGISSNFIY